MNWKKILKREVSDTLEIDPNNPLYRKYGWDESQTHWDKDKTKRTGDEFSHGLKIEVEQDRKKWEDKSIQVLNALSNEQPYWIHIDDFLYFSDEHNIRSIFRNPSNYKRHLDEMVEAGIIEIKMDGKNKNIEFYQPPGSNLHEAPTEES
tara:strand:- start:377 stop:823 length:447 start_codon:yes stop_codon:yes gene_type:complete